MTDRNTQSADDGAFREGDPPIVPTSGINQAPSKAFRVFNKIWMIVTLAFILGTIAIFAMFAWGLISLARMGAMASPQ